MRKSNFKFKYFDINLTINKGSFISVIGNNNNSIINSFKGKNIELITYKELFNLNCENILNDIKKYTNDVNKYLNDFGITSINKLLTTDRIKIKILFAILKNNMIVIDNILNLLDFEDYRLILKILKSYTLKGNIVVNLTNISEEILFSDKVMIVYNNKLVGYEDVLEVINQEKLMKSIGVGLPFIVLLNRYLMDYGLIEKYYLSNKKLVGALWE